MCQLYIDFLLVCKTESKVYVHYNTGEGENSYIWVFQSHLSYKSNKKRKKLFFAKYSATKWLYHSDVSKGRFLRFFLKVDCMNVFSGFPLFSWFSI